MIKTANPTTPALDAAIDAILTYAATLDNLADIDFTDIAESILTTDDSADPIMTHLIRAADLIRTASPFSARELADLIDYRAYFRIIAS
jgi:hypothetical protein